MKERPILFQGAMVRALLAGKKTQTRRVVKPQPIRLDDPANVWKRKDMATGCPIAAPTPRTPVQWSIPSPYGYRGDRLWVKETFSARHGLCHLKPTDLPSSTRILYRADHDLPVMGVCPWWPSLFMRRWMSRITLEIVSVRVERLNKISAADAIAEGIEKVKGSWRNYERVGSTWRGSDAARRSYQSLWDSINASPKPVKGEGGEISHYVSYPWGEDALPGSFRGKPWHVIPNPWVWVVEFRRVQA